MYWNTNRAFKNKPIESRLDPRDFIPSDYAETVTFIS